MDQNNDGGMNAEQNVAPQETPSAPMQAPVTNADSVGDYKLFAILGYILPFLFFIPMVNESSKNNPFARFHANQQLTLLVISIGVYVISNLFFGMGLYFIMPLVNIALLVLVIMGVIHAAQGEMKELPVVGGIKLLDKVFKA